MAAQTTRSDIHPLGTGHHVLRRTLSFFKPYRWRMLLAGCFVAFTGITVSLMPLFTKYVIDNIIQSNAVPSTHKFSFTLLVMGGFVLLMILRMASWYAGQSYLLFIREKIIFSLRTAVFNKLQELCMRFHQKYNPGFLFDRTLGGASTSVGVFLSMLFNTLVTYVFTLTASVVICLKLHAGLTLWVLVMSTGYIFISKYFNRRIHDLTKALNLEVNKFAGQVTDILRGVKTIKAFAMEQRVISDFDEQLWPLQLRSLDINKQTMFMGFISEGLGYLISALVVIAGAYLVVGKQIPLGTMVAFIAYQSSVTGMLGALYTVAGTYGAAMAGLEQMYEILDEQPTVVERPGAKMPATVEGEIRFEDVHFAYDEKPVIQGITLQVPPGQSVALVGPSGGGKTTLTNLLLRFYDPDHGRVLLDGGDIRKLPLTPYRSLFGVVLQYPFLFNETILSNLLAVKPEATKAELREALERAQAWEFVSQLKNGWHYKVGESGSQLSGGQRQRISLARCFLTDPRIMVLDEATSALDNQSEMLVQQALQEIMRSRTVFVIAHRLSTVRHVDRVLVVQDGGIVQDGTFAQLCQESGLFRDLHLATLSAADASMPGQV
ncbi:MAG: ABC transporter ATP-binding protein [Armatimonadota bacterium]